MLNYLRAVISVHSSRSDEKGASAVEYGLLIAGIAALIVAVVFIFGDALSDIFQETCDSVTQSATVADCS